MRDVSKAVWKRKIKKYIYDKQRNELLEDMRSYKKLNVEELSKEPFERKAFLSELNLERSRMKYKLLSSVVPTVRSHFSNKYKEKSLACPECSSNESADTDQVKDRHNNSNNLDASKPKDTVDHIVLHCKEYDDLKDEGFDPLNDDMLTDFFGKVIQRRIEKGYD